MEQAAVEADNSAGVIDNGPIIHVENVTGRWTTDEHTRFVDATRLHGKNWKIVQQYVPTRTVVQIRTHAQKYFAKIDKLANTADDEGNQVTRETLMTADVMRTTDRPRRQTIHASAAAATRSRTCSTLGTLTPLKDPHAHYAEEEQRAADLRRAHHAAGTSSIEQHQTVGEIGMELAVGSVCGTGSGRGAGTDDDENPPGPLDEMGDLDISIVDGELTTGARARGGASYASGEVVDGITDDELRSDASVESRPRRAPCSTFPFPPAMAPFSTAPLPISESDVSATVGRGGVEHGGLKARRRARKSGTTGTSGDVLGMSAGGACAGSRMSSSGSSYYGHDCISSDHVGGESYQAVGVSEIGDGGNGAFGVGGLVKTAGVKRGRVNDSTLGFDEDDVHGDESNDISSASGPDLDPQFLPGGPTHNLVYPNGSGSTNIPTVSTNSPGGYHESKAHLLPKNLTHVQSEKGDNDMGTGSRCSTFKTYINPRDTNPSVGVFFSPVDREEPWGGSQSSDGGTSHNASSNEDTIDVEGLTQADGSGSPATPGKESRQGKRRCVEVPIPTSDAVAPITAAQRPTSFMSGVSPRSLNVSCPPASQSATPGNTSSARSTKTNTNTSASATRGSVSTPAVGSGSGALSFENEVLVSTDLKSEVQLHVEAGGVDGLDIAKGLWVDDPQGAKGAELPTLGVNPRLLGDNGLGADVECSSGADNHDDDEILGFLACDEPQSPVMGAGALVGLMGV